MPLIEIQSILGLSDTNITSVADLDLFQFDTTSGKWRNRTTKQVGVPDSLSDVDSSLVTGIKLGGIGSINSGDGTKFDIASGEGFVIDNHTDPENPVVNEVSWSAFSAQTVTNIATSEFSFIGINSSGAIVQQITPFDTADIRDIITIMVLIHPDNVNIDDIVQIQRPVFNRYLGAYDFEDSVGVVNKDGNVYSANGANLNLDKSAGETFRIGSNYSTSFKSPNVTVNPSGTAISFQYVFQDGSGGFTIDPSVTLVEPDLYDDGSGTPATVPNNRFTIQRLFYFAALDKTDIQYGQFIYQNLADAEAAILAEAFSIAPLLNSVSSFRGWLILKKNNTDLTDTGEVKFIEADLFGGSGGGASSSTTTLQQAYDNSLPDPEILTNSTQGALTLRRGSAADSDDVLEVQNNAAAQTFAVTGLGDLTANTLTSTVAIGTAPLNVTSITVVPNLNVDQVDGRDEGEFALLAGRSGGQTLIGGIASGDDLTFNSTSNATKGSFFFDTTVSTSVDPSELVLGNNKWIRGVNNAGTDTIKMIRVTSTDIIRIGTKVGINADAIVAEVLHVNGVEGTRGQMIITQSDVTGPAQLAFVSKFAGFDQREWMIEADDNTTDSLNFKDITAGTTPLRIVGATGAVGFLKSSPISPVDIGGQSSDPSSVTDGGIWHQTTAIEMRCHINGQTKPIADIGILANTGLSVTSGLPSTGYASPSSATLNGIENQRQMSVPRNFTAKNLFAFCGSNSLNGTIVITVRKNAAATAIKITITAGSTATFSDTSNTVTFVAGDKFSFEVVENASSGGANLAISLEAA